jgi:hypothetical protein
MFGLQIILKFQLNSWKNSKEIEMQHKTLKTQYLFEFTKYI